MHFHIQTAISLMDILHKTFLQPDFNAKLEPVNPSNAKHPQEIFTNSKHIAIARLKSKANAWNTSAIIADLIREHSLSCHQATLLYVEALLEELGVLEELESKGVDTAFLRLTEPPPREPEPEPAPEPTGREPNPIDRLV